MAKNVKKRRITAKDWDSVAEYIQNQLKARESSKFRKQAEKIWKEVDRQVAMQPMMRTKKNVQQRKGDWRAALELGELSRASEVLSADIRRLTFPHNRTWFEPHVEIPPIISEDGQQYADVEVQMRSDGQLQALMAQQHLDFGFKERVGLSIKESLHHGSYVVEVEEKTMLGAKPDGSLKDITAPVWVPHSMWNCYPDSAPSVMAGTLFYTGSMIIKSSMGYDQLQGCKGGGWLTDNISKIERPRLDKDVELISYHGDIVIKRAKDDIFLPNVKAIVADNKVVYYKPNNLPYSRIIYNGYERLDVRDPYYVSPLIKMSSTQKIATVMANKMLDSVAMTVEPPVVYDGNDADLVKTGGPIIAPGAKTPTKNMANFKEVRVGEPGAALAALQFHMTELQKGTSVDAVRSGISAGTEQTATEVERTRQGGQIRTVDFVDKHELQGLRPFLYLQHQMNLENLKSYQFYNPSIDAPDFERLTKQELQEMSNVHFDIVGSKGLIEEEQRQAQTMQVTQFLFSIGQGDKVNMTTVCKELYQDAGNKNPERFLNIPGNEDVSQVVAQAQAQMDQMAQQMQALQEENQKLQTQEYSRIQDAKVKEAEIAQESELRLREAEAKEQASAQNAQEQLELKLDAQERKFANELELEKEKAAYTHEAQMFEIFVSQVEKESASSKEAEESEAKEASSEAMMASFEKIMADFAKSVTAPKEVIRGEDNLIDSIVTNPPRLDS